MRTIALCMLGAVLYAAPIRAQSLPYKQSQALPKAGAAVGSYGQLSAAEDPSGNAQLLQLDASKDLKVTTTSSTGAADVVATGTLATDGDVVSLSLGTGQSTVFVSLTSGTGSSIDITFVIETTADGTNWVPATGVKITDSGNFSFTTYPVTGSAITSANDTQTWSMAPGGAKKIRVRAIVVTNSTASVTLIGTVGGPPQYNSVVIGAEPTQLTAQMVDANITSQAARIAAPGNDASNGNAVYVMPGIYQATPATLTNGKEGVLEVDSTGHLIAVGQGTAGTPAGGVVTVQGVTSMTPLSVSQSTAASASGAWPVKWTDGTNVAAVKAASTAAVAADPSAVVALSPNSPLPTGSNTIGTVTAAPQTVSTYETPDATGCPSGAHHLCSVGTSQVQVFDANSTRHSFSIQNESANIVYCSGVTGVTSSAYDWQIAANQTLSVSGQGSTVFCIASGSSSNIAPVAY